MERHEPITTGDGRPVTERAEHDRRALGRLFRELSEESSALVHAEMALARRELSEKVDSAQRGVTAIGAGAAVGYAGLLLVLGAIVLLFARVVPLWVSALLIGIAVGAIGFGLAQRGRQRISAEQLTPERTLRQAGKTVEMGKEQMAS